MWEEVRRQAEHHLVSAEKPLWIGGEDPADVVSIWRTGTDHPHPAMSERDAGKGAARAVHSGAGIGACVVR